MKKIAIIPARSGSKRLKDKNIKMFNGKPLIAHSIGAAIEANIFDVVHLSTDSEEYAEIGRKFYADVPFLRGNDTSSDTASSWDMVKEVIENYKKKEIVFDLFMLLQPTSPLRSSVDILNAYDLMIQKKANAIVSVCEIEYSPLLCNTLPQDLSLCNFLKISEQKTEKYYRLNGAIYLSKVAYFMNTNNIYSYGCYAYIMKRENSIDIDTELDFDIAEYLTKQTK